MLASVVVALVALVPQHSLQAAQAGRSTVSAAASAILTSRSCNHLVSKNLHHSGVLGGMHSPQPRRQRASTVVMGRKFENNKLKMAKTALAYAKKASYIGKKVVIAVKSGGDDPETNRALASVLREANSLDVPKDVVERNIKKAMDPVTEDYKELTYEAYGYGGVGFIINVLSDNNNRATADVNMIVSKTGCKSASAGSVAFNFQRKGRLTLNKEITEDELLEMAVEAGCDGDVSLEQPDPDGRSDGEEVKCVVITEATELGALQAVLQEADIGCSGALVQIPLTTVECSPEDEEANFKAIDRLEELDDVTNVEHNMKI